MTPEEHADNICRWTNPGLRERVIGEIRAAAAEARKACHVESRPDGYWLVLKNRSGGAVINLDGPSRGPIVRTVLMIAALDAGKQSHA